MKLFLILLLAFCSLASAAQIQENLLSALTLKELPNSEQRLFLAIQDAVPRLFAEPMSTALLSVMVFINTETYSLFKMLSDYEAAADKIDLDVGMAAWQGTPVYSELFDGYRFGLTVNGILNQWYITQTETPTWIIKQIIIQALVHHHGLDPSYAQTIFDGMEAEGIIDTRTDLIGDIGAIIKKVNELRGV